VLANGMNRPAIQPARTRECRQLGPDRVATPDADGRQHDLAFPHLDVEVLERDDASIALLGSVR